MNKLGAACVLLVLLAFFSPAHAVTGSLAVEGSSIAIVLILVAYFSLEFVCYGVSLNLILSLWKPIHKSHSYRLRALDV